MSERSILKGIGEAILGLKGSKPGVQPMTTIEHRCPECRNALDPSWKLCPYCEAKKKAGDKTSRMPSAAASPPAAASRTSTRIDAPGPAVAASGPAGRGHTMVDSSPAGSGVARAGGGGRKLTGIVTSFTWSRLGQLFEVRDGRNFVGSGDVSSENNRRCDICIADDQIMSSAHFLILCQNGKYIISDNLSTNGTFVNDEQIDTRGVELPDHAKIKAGATVFMFQKIIQSAKSGASTEPAPDDTGSQRHSGGGREPTVI